MLIPPRAGQERILIYGDAKIGKSTCWGDIIRVASEEGYDGRFFIIDTDRTWNKMAPMVVGDLESDVRLVDEVIDGTPLPDIPIVVYEPDDILEAAVMAREIQRTLRRDDWVFIDMMDWFWQEAQDEYTRQVHEMEPENYFLAMRAQSKKKKAETGKGSKTDYGGQEGTDWQFIGKVYNQAVLPLVKKSRGKFVMVTPESKLSDEWATADQIAQYKKAGGMKPAGQKRLPHQCDTMLRMVRQSNGVRKLQMVGDRGREKAWEDRGSTTIQLGDITEGEPGFVEEYLVEIGGWTIEEKVVTATRMPTPATTRTRGRSRSRSAESSPTTRTRSRSRSRASE